MWGVGDFMPGRMPGGGGRGAVKRFSYCGEGRKRLLISLTSTLFSSRRIKFFHFFGRIAQPLFHIFNVLLQR